jgi:hypothetical protein
LPWYSWTIVLNNNHWLYYVMLTRSSNIHEGNSHGSWWRNRLGHDQADYVMMSHAPLGHIILIPSQPVFALSPYCCVISGEASNTNFIVFGLTRPGLEPTIYCTSVNCCFSDQALYKSNSACWPSTKRTSSSSHWTLTCSCHDIAEQLC